MRYIGIVIASIILLLMTSAIRADEMGIIVGSKHLGVHYAYNFNENNSGLYYKKDNWEIGVYKNSLYSTSFYTGFDQNLISTKTVDFSLFVGIVTGYQDGDEEKYIKKDVTVIEEGPKSKLMAAIFPHVAFKSDNFKLDFGLVPNPARIFGYGKGTFGYSGVVTVRAGLEF